MLRHLCDLSSKNVAVSCVIDREVTKQACIYFTIVMQDWHEESSFDKMKYLLQSVYLDPRVPKQRFRFETHRGDPKNVAQAGTPSLWQSLISTGATLHSHCSLA